MKRLHWIGIILGLWAVAAYLLLPFAWKAYFRHHRFDEGPRITQTSDGHPGDPVNLGIEGGERDLVTSMTAAGWYPSDPVTLASSLRIIRNSVFPSPDPNAPVSALYLFGRKQDLAFELPVGDNPRRRHHVRFWKWNKRKDGRAVWFGAATYDERVGLSHTTGQVTHHVAPDVDADRDLVMGTLQKAGHTSEEYYIAGFHPVTEGRNGGGDPWHTDGRLGAVVLKPEPKR